MSVNIEFDVMEFRGRFSVDADDFAGMTTEQIKEEVQEKTDEFAKANLSFFVENMDAVVKAIEVKLAEKAKADQREIIEQFEAGDFGDVEFTELALAAGMDLAEINAVLESHREGAL